MTKDEIRETLRSYILRNFLPGEAPETLKDSTLLLTSGVIASLSLVELVTFIEEEFGVSLEEEDMGAERMDSIDRLVDLVSERLGRVQAPVR